MANTQFFVQMEALINPACRNELTLPYSLPGSFGKKNPILHSLGQKPEKKNNNTVDQVSGSHQIPWRGHLDSDVLIYFKVIWPSQKNPCRCDKATMNRVGSIWSKSERRERCYCEKWAWKGQLLSTTSFTWQTLMSLFSAKFCTWQREHLNNKDTALKKKSEQYNVDAKSVTGTSRPLTQSSKVREAAEEGECLF